MRRRDPRRGLAWPLVAALLLVAGCAGSSGPPAIAPGTLCATCGMEVRDLRFACERRASSDWRVYDAIECLVRDARASAMEAGVDSSAIRPIGDAAAAQPGTRDTWLADYDTQVLHAADSVWVVRGAFPSPMGGGFAAFRDRAAADSIAAMTSGRVDRLAAFLAEPRGDAR